MSVELWKRLLRGATCLVQRVPATERVGEESDRTSSKANMINMLLYCVSVLRELQCCYKVASLYHIFCRYAAAATATGSGVRAAAEDAAERSDRNRALAIQLLLLFLLLCSRRSIHVACGRGPLDGAAPLLPARALCIHCFECCSARSLLLSLI